MPDTEPQKGDLIRMFRNGYQHWAVYIGDGFIVHISIPSEDEKSSGQNKKKKKKKAFVKKERLVDAAGTDRWKVDNELDKTYKPRPSDDIIRDALSMVGEERDYNVTTHNCEHFATELRYGKSRSLQVDNALVGTAAALSAIPPLGIYTLAFLIWSLVHRFRR